MPGRSITQRASRRFGLTLRLPMTKVGLRPSLRQEREGPNRSALRHLVLEPLARDVPVEPADAGQHGDVLSTLVRVSDRDGVDTRPGLELPNDLAGVGIDCTELAGLFASEQQAAAGGQHRRPNPELHPWHTPLLPRREP